MTQPLKEEILSFVTEWMNLEDIVLSGINKAQKSKYYMILFMGNRKLNSEVEQNGGSQRPG